MDPTAKIIGNPPSPEHPRAMLLVYDGHDVIHTDLLPNRAFIVGRDPKANVVVSNVSVSKRHASLIFDGQQKVTVEDLGSTNGTIYHGHDIRHDKPIDVCHGSEIYFGSVLGIIHVPSIQSANGGPTPLLSNELDAEQIVAGTPTMKRVLEDIESFGRAKATVILTGETGTGKEEIAKLIHCQSSRRNKPFIVLNCAVISEHLLESKLFGHEKGAFTGALGQTKGYFEEANGGTLVLDEIGDLSDEGQRALLRVLETGKITRVGSIREIAVDVRLIAATWRDLKALCEKGKFRWDLYHRLHVLHIHLPPLRERREDIPKLVGRFLQRANHHNGRHVKSIDNDALTMLLDYAWPGNIRELRNWIERAVVVAKSEAITVADLPSHMDSRHEFAANPDKPRPVSPKNLEQAVNALRKETIEEALRQTRGTTAGAAHLLGLELRTFQRYMKAHGIQSIPRGKK